MCLPEQSKIQLFPIIIKCVTEYKFMNILNPISFWYYGIANDFLQIWTFITFHLVQISPIIIWMYTSFNFEIYRKLEGWDTVLRAMQHFNTNYFLGTSVLTALFVHHTFINVFVMQLKTSKRTFLSIMDYIT